MKLLICPDLIGLSETEEKWNKMTTEEISYELTREDFSMHSNADSTTMDLFLVENYKVYNTVIKLKNMVHNISPRTMTINGNQTTSYLYTACNNICNSVKIIHQTLKRISLLYDKSPVYEIKSNDDIDIIDAEYKKILYYKNLISNDFLMSRDGLFDDIISYDIYLKDFNELEQSLNNDVIHNTNYKKYDNSIIQVLYYMDFYCKIFHNAIVTRIIERYKRYNEGWWGFRKSYYASLWKYFLDTTLINIRNEIGICIKFCKDFNANTFFTLRDIINNIIQNKKFNARQTKILHDYYVVTEDKQGSILNSLYSSFAKR